MCQPMIEALRERVTREVTEEAAAAPNAFWGLGLGAFAVMREEIERRIAAELPDMNSDWTLAP